MTPVFFNFRYRMGRLVFLLPLLAILTLSACSGKNRPITKLFTPTTETKVCRVTVLPFTHTQATSRLALKAERILFSELVNSAQFEVVPEGDVNLFFNRSRIVPGTVFATSQLAALHRQLGVDAIIIGRIHEASNSKVSRRNSENFISFQLDMIDTRTGKMLAATFLRRAESDYKKIIHFGIVTTESGLLEHMAREILTQWQILGLGGC